MLDEFFELREDGWHNETCDEVLARFREGEPEREAKKANEDNRLKRHREERARLFKTLTDAGQHAPWNIKIEELRALIAGITATGKMETVTQPATAPATPATATQAPSTRHQTPDIEHSSSLTVADRTEGGGLPSGSRIGGLCQRLRRIGINASPALLAKPGWAPVLDRLDDEFIVAVVEQRLRTNPGESFTIAYFLPALTDIINGQSRPQNGGIHAERSRVLDQLTGRATVSADDRIIEGEARVVG